MLDITVVICTRRRPTILARCLSAVGRLNPAPAEVILVDNSQGDPATRKIAYDFGVRYTVEPKAGLSAARKRGLAECNTQDVAYLEDDALPEPDWLETRLRPSAREESTEPAGKVLDFDLRRRKHQQSTGTLENNAE